MKAGFSSSFQKIDVSLHKWAGVDVECEVFNLFLGLVPQPGLARIEAGRKRQGLVPEFHVKEPSTSGACQQMCCIAIVSWQIHAKRVGVVGPIQAKLANYTPLRGWVFGAWGRPLMMYTKW